MNTTRRQFLSSLSAAIAGIGTFNILPGTGRLWRARRKNPWEDKIIPIIYRRRIEPFVPTIQDFIAAGQRSSKHEMEAILELLNEPKIWPPNMGETQRLVAEQRPLIKPL